MARAIKQYGLHMTQLWFNGNDQQTLNSNESLMQNVYFSISSRAVLSARRPNTRV